MDRITFGEWLRKTRTDKGWSQPAPASALQDLDDQLAGLTELRHTVQTGFEARLYTPEEAQRRIVAIETDTDRLTRRRERVARSESHRAALLALAAQDIDRLHHWIKQDDPTTVNHLLTALCETITLTPRYEMTITWR